MANNQKSIWRAYLCWLLGGIFGLHHFYLRRDRQAFICWSTFGGYVFGWLTDVFLIPEMVRDTNDDPRFVESFKEKLRVRRRPPFELGKLCSSMMVAFLWAQIFLIAIPNADYYDGFNWSVLLHWLVPVVVALGVWTVGNCGRQQGRIVPCLAAAYVTYAPLRLVLVLDDAVWLAGVVFVSSLVFELWSKEWLLTSPPRRSLKRRVATLYVCGCVYLALFGGYFYFNGKITDSAGDVVPVHEAIANALKSPVWSDLKQSLGETWAHVEHRGFSATWQMIVEQMDTGGEQRAMQVLGILPTASQSEITAIFRRLSKENHPDKVKGTPEEKRAAQERFMQISQAYEKLSKLKSKRRQKNHKSAERADPIVL